MAKDQAETLRPGVDVTVEVHQPDRALATGERAQQRQRDRMIAAERDEVPNWCRLLLDLGERALDIAVRDAEVADIGEIKLLDLGPGGRMVAVDQHAARLADRRRAEPRPRTVRGAEIERDAGYADRRVGVRAFDAEKTRPDSKSRYRCHGLLSGIVTRINNTSYFNDLDDGLRVWRHGFANVRSRPGNDFDQKNTG